MQSTPIEFKTNYAKVRDKKVVRTLELCLVRSKYFLGANVDHDLLDTTAKLKNGKLYIKSGAWHGFYHKLYELDAAIRWTDDIIDEDLVGQKEINYKKIDQVISEFEKTPGIDPFVGQLYRREFKVWKSDGKSLKQKKKELIEHVQVRMIDLLFLMETIVTETGSKLEKDQLTWARKMLNTWEEIDALVTDVRGLREDRLRNSYNVFIFAKRNGLKVSDLSKYLEKNLEKLKVYRSKIIRHPHPDFLDNALKNTNLVCNKLYLPWIGAYEKDEDDWLKGVGSTLI